MCPSGRGASVGFCQSSETKTSANCPFIFLVNGFLWMAGSCPATCTSSPPPCCQSHQLEPVPGWLAWDCVLKRWELLVPVRCEVSKEHPAVFLKPIFSILQAPFLPCTPFFWGLAGTWGSLGAAPPAQVCQSRRMFFQQVDPPLSKAEQLCHHH